MVEVEAIDVNHGGCQAHQVSGTVSIKHLGCLIRCVKLASRPVIWARFMVTPQRATQSSVGVCSPSPGSRVRHCPIKQGRHHRVRLVDQVREYLGCVLRRGHAGDERFEAQSLRGHQLEDDLNVAFDRMLVKRIPVQGVAPFMGPQQIHRASPPQMHPIEQRRDIRVQTAAGRTQKDHVALALRSCDRLAAAVRV